MKYLLKMAIALVFLIPVSTTHAQMSSSASTKTKDSDQQSQEYASKQKSNVIEYTNNEWGYLLDDFTCTNGDKVSKDGILTKLDGTTIKLNDGDKVFRDGRYVSVAVAASAKPKKQHK